MLPPQPRQTQTNGVTSAPVRPLLNSCLVVCFNQYIPNSHSLCHKLCCCLLVCITCISVYKVCILDPLCLTSDNSSVPTAQSLYPCICICSSLVLCWLSSPLLSQCICVPFLPSRICSVVLQLFMLLVTVCSCVCCLQSASDFGSLTVHHVYMW